MYELSLVEDENGPAIAKAGPFTERQAADEVEERNIDRRTDEYPRWVYDRIGMIDMKSRR